MYVIDKNNLISKVGRDILDSNFGGMKLFKNESKYQARKSGSSYSQDINEFAIYLHFYSPRAYKFVRNTSFTTSCYA